MDRALRPRFLNRLRKATEDRKIRWEEGRDEYWFHTEVGRFIYTVNSTDSDDFPPFSFRIFPNTQEVPSSAIEVWDWDPNGIEDTNGPMEQLYRTVKRSTLGLDNVAHDMLEDLAAADGGPAELSADYDAPPAF